MREDEEDLRRKCEKVLESIDVAETVSELASGLARANHLLLFS